MGDEAHPVPSLRVAGGVDPFVEERVSHATLGFVSSGAMSSSVVFPESVFPMT